MKVLKNISIAPFIFFISGIFLSPFAFTQQSLPQQNKNPSASKSSNSNRYHLEGYKIHTQAFSDEDHFKYLYFKGAVYPDGQLPHFVLKKKTGNNTSEILAVLKNAVFEEVSSEEAQLLSKQDGMISESVKVTAVISYSRKIPQVIISFIPFRENKSTGKYEKLIAFDLETETAGGKTDAASGSFQYKTSSSSVLATGSWFKAGVTEDGIYKLSYSFLENSGIDMSKLSFQNFGVFGNKSGMLPYNNSEPVPDDLTEIAIWVEDINGNNRFDKEDYVLFYGQSPHRWKSTGTLFTQERHLYSDTTYYFITPDMGNRKPITSQASQGSSTTTVTTFNDYAIHEQEIHNLLKSGRRWYGEQFNIVTSYNFPFSFPNRDPSSQVRVNTAVAAKTVGASSSFTINTGSASDAVVISPVGDKYTSIFAIHATNTIDFNPGSSSFIVDVSFNKGNTGAIGWLDNIEVNARRQLRMSGNQMLFRDVLSTGAGNIAGYRLSNANAQVRIWDVSDPVNVKWQQGSLQGNILEFNVSSTTLREFIAFNGNSFSTPTSLGKIPNQNLHGMSAANLIILTHPRFLTHAQELAEFHKQEDGLSYLIVTTDQVYNEFSTGAQDITAIKRFAKMFYDRAGNDPELMPDYLLLLGDGSIDPKDRISGNNNFIPTYQSANSLDPTKSYVSDDYFGLLDDTEGESASDLLDIGIGRLPVRTAVEAANAIKKIKHYYRQQTMRSWRNWITFVADDEDGHLHMKQADGLADSLKKYHPEYNVDKVYFDAYTQQATPGGQRYPEVNRAIDNRMNKGALIVSYTGHGGGLGWAHERVLDISMINNWSNLDNMPLFLTATCEFSRFDNPQRRAAGEHTVLNPKGGVIGLMTTTRLAWAHSNQRLAIAFYHHAFTEVNNEMPRLGDICRLTKNDEPGSANTRNFVLLGDPAVKLAYPEKRIYTTSVPDTIKALSKVTIKGYVGDENGQKLSSYNGIVYPQVFDKPATVETQNNNDDGIFVFDLQRNILFNGKSSVKNGEFKFTFVVPKDISYTYGNGKISYYAENGETDAQGYDEDFIIGGASDNPVTDNEGPDTDLYMNDEDFVFGGVTDENPDLYAIVFDESGINTTGNGLGHDITAVLDENTPQSIVLNDYYESGLDSYQKGSIRYPFSDLEEGQHTLSLKMWDVHNNSGQAYTEFVVAHSAEIALAHVLNYPNPFTTNTAFYFEHNQPGQALDVRIQIFTVTGKLIKTIDSWVTDNSFRVGPIYWDGLDDFGDKIGKGVYIYRLKVAGPSGNFADKYEKLVILQ